VKPDTSSVPFRRIAIVGLGLMGGSLARALRRLADPPYIAAASRDAGELERARAEGVVDRTALDADEIVADADLVVYATPVGVILDLLDRHRGLWAEGAVLTDLGSVKRPVIERARAVGVADRFVGGHPMAGGHGSGLAAAREDLYVGARVWLTPAGDAAPVERVASFWRALGARPELIEARTHDELVAWASHLPQVAAFALGAVLADSGCSVGMLGPGGRDTTRLAASSPQLWSDILRHNADLVLGPLNELRRTLDGLAGLLERGDGEGLARAFEKARVWREG
jgi:prephenate dehydrogenase